MEANTESSFHNKDKICKILTGMGVIESLCGSNCKLKLSLSAKGTTKACDRRAILKTFLGKQ
jgi:hypothetical protein